MTTQKNWIKQQMYLRVRTTKRKVEMQVPQRKSFPRIRFRGRRNLQWIFVEVKQEGSIENLMISVIYAFLFQYTPTHCNNFLQIQILTQFYPQNHRMNTKEKIPSFLQNMQELSSLKQQLLCIRHMFSPDAINYQQLKLISQLREQLQQSQKQITQLQNTIKTNNKNSEENKSRMQKQMKELEDVNLQLVGYNDKLVVQLQATSNKLQNLGAQLQKQKQMHKDLQNKYSRELQNIKLMHSQQLYILRKKDKKSNNN